MGTWDAALVCGYTPVTWYATVAEGAPVGNYTFDVSLTGGNDLAGPIVVSVSAPEAHGEKPPDVGDDTTAPDVTITPVDTSPELHGHVRSSPRTRRRRRSSAG